ncbi:hypothetical protein [Bacillus sp. Hm123]|uniref:hypothetical protein n=1 Tax=Bacillus sp. Hm123 TaxID=3450745 RepID=UPI003F439A58
MSEIISKINGTAIHQTEDRIVLSANKIDLNGVVVLDEQPQKPLLVIEVQDLDSAPVVKYKGEIVDKKAAVSYGWKTIGAEDEPDGKHDFCIEYYECEEGERIPVIKKNSENKF